MGNKHILKEFISFIRVENGLFASGIAISGYVIFNHADFLMLPLFIAMFLGTCASYGYNYLKDIREDFVNKETLNKFVLEEGKGRNIVVCFYIFGFVSSLLLSAASCIVYLFLILLSIIYSGMVRIKERFLVKNFHTGFAISLSFVVGAAAGGVVSVQITPYVLIIFILGFAANMLGDIRGYRGDKSIGMLTLPILIGFGKTKLIIHLLIISFLTSILFFRYSDFYPLVPFMVLASILLFKNRLIGVRILFLSSFACLPVFLLISNLIGGAL